MTHGMDATRRIVRCVLLAASLAFVARDVRHAMRQWRRTPLVTAMVLLSLTLGIGTSAALFAVVEALYLRDLPVREPGRVVKLVVETRDSVFSTSVWEYLRDTQSVFEGVAATASDRLNLSDGGESRYAQALFVSGSFFDVMGVSARLGRPLGSRDDIQGAATVAVIGHGLWQRAFAGRPDAIGRTLVLEGHPVEIVGVTPPGFFGVEVGRQVDVILPIAAHLTIRGPASPAANRGAAWLHVFGRLRGGQAPGQASAALRAWQPVLRHATLPEGVAPAGHLRDPLDVAPAGRGISIVRGQFGRPLVMLLGAVGIVLVIACANLAALVLARFTDRQAEMRIRRALGATRTRLVRGLLAETLLLSAAGAALGVGLALWVTRLVVASLVVPIDRGIEPHLAIGLDWRLVASGAALALLSGLLAGLPPAIRAASGSASSSVALVTHGGTQGRAHARMLQMLVAGQVALSVVLIAMSALLVRSFVQLTGQPTALDHDRVLLAALGGNVFERTPAATLARVEALTTRLGTVPGVEAVSVSTLTPLSGYIMLSRIEVPGFVSADIRDVNASVNRVTPSFFTVFGTPLLAGRPFDDRDHAEAPRVAIVNTAFAERYLHGANAVGRVIKLNGRETEIVGLVETGKYMTLREPRMRFVFVPLAQALGPRPQPLRLGIRGPNPAQLRGPILHALRTFDASLTVEFRTLEDEIATSVNRERLLAWVGTLFAVLALLIAVIGVYGTFSYLVARRRVEFGVRMAVGADRPAILRLVLRHAAGTVTAGCLLGLVGTVPVTRLLEAVLFGVSPSDPAVLGLAAGVMIATGGIASYLPARRAARSDPMCALREP